jgi:hypothetical protein
MSHLFTDDQRRRGGFTTAIARNEKADRRALEVGPIICDMLDAPPRLRNGRMRGQRMSAIARELTRRGILAPRGGNRWCSWQVERDLARYLKLTAS